MRALERRLSRLESESERCNGKPRTYFRMNLIRLDRVPGLIGATCTRRLSSDGASVHESVVLGHSDTGKRITDEELDRWVGSFPIEPYRPGIQPIEISKD